MSRSDDLRVADIVEDAEQLGELVACGCDAFDADWTRQRASERLLEIIGVEALRRSLSGLSHGAESDPLVVSDLGDL